MEELFTAPADLTLVGDDELATLEEQATAELARVNGLTLSPEVLAYMQRLAASIDALRTEKVARDHRAADSARREQERLETQRTQLLEHVNGPTTDHEGVLQGEVMDTEAIARGAAEGVAATLIAAFGGNGPTPLTDLTRRATQSLVAARQHVPTVAAPRPRLSVTAGVDIPGIARGGELNLDSLIDAFYRRSKGMPVTRDGRGNEQLVATIHNDYEHTIDDRTSTGQVEELLRHMLSDDNKRSLVAGGGWCAPSEIRYDFFNIVGVDGLVDLPTVGVARGGIRYPTSPTIADAFSNTTAVSGFGGFAYPLGNTTVPWLWTETDDQLTVTGSVNKPTLRVPCPSFNEVRLECYGITLTAGNLTDNAYPEATANFLRLLIAAHAHAMNGRILAQMVTASSGATTIAADANNASAASRLVNAIALAATDYRARYAMSTDAVLEVVVPYWLKEVIRADMSHRGPGDHVTVSDAEINAYFGVRNVRVQYVNDWQVRGASQFGNASAMTAWPTTVDFLVYAAGTFLKGNGLTLDLGVVRDSVLNAENDYTAAWSEECHLLARVGHESRRYTCAFAVSGGYSGATTNGARV